MEIDAAKQNLILKVTH